MLTVEEKLCDECTCHVCPPCAWCLSLTEEEADAFSRGGRYAVYAAIEASIPCDVCGHCEDCNCHLGSV